MNRWETSRESSRTRYERKTPSNSEKGKRKREMLGAPRSHFIFNIAEALDSDGWIDRTIEGICTSDELLVPVLNDKPNQF